MSELSTDMEGVVARLAEEYSNAEVFDNWLPPDGPHTAVITGYKDGITKQSSAWWGLACRLLTPGEGLEDRDFTLIYREGAIGIMKGAAKILNGGTQSNDLRESIGILQASTGKMINLMCSTTIKDDRTYRNANITEVVPDVPETPAE